jgi:mannosyl-3-phosphoglycerate phosphatase
MAKPNYIVFTDLDGTMLDHHTYSYEESLPGLELLRRHKIPLVFCSAKTRVEQASYRDALKVRDPFIVENGGAIFAEQGYFRKQSGFSPTKDGLEVLALAKPYAEIRRILGEVRAELNLPIRGYGDMTVEEVSRLVDLDRDAAACAMQREFEETVVTQLSDADRESFRKALATRGVSMTSGARFISVSTSNDKGRAARLLIEAFRRELGEVVSVGIGDSWNDAPLLAVTDISLLVQRPEGHWAALAVPGIRQINGIGPKGWTLAMQQLVDGKLGHD